ncbi:DUF6789 family protein [Brevundimonas diminuta]|uniref:DUF6789 family protein n=1 Tax=Brevundimonas diminuta TaxID=293 RepID=UPI003D003707
MSRVKKGIIAGFAATVAVSVLEVANLFLNHLFDPFPGVVARLFGMPGNMAAGWGLHLVIGTFALGSLFGVLYPRLPSATPVTKGIVFAVGAWVLMMLYITMAGDYRTFTGSSGFGTFGWMLALHMVFGAVMGNVYARLVERERRGVAPIGAAPAH